jgi:hypothetical protein
MLAPTPPPGIITHSQSKPLVESLLLGFLLIGMMIVGAAFLYFVTEGLLWLEGYFAIKS